MEYTADYCVKKIGEFETQKEASEEELKATTNPGTFTELKKTFEVNQDKRKKALQEIKDKKFIRLKYRSQHQYRNQYGETSNANNEQQNVQQKDARKEHLPRRNSRTNLNSQGRVDRSNSRTGLTNNHQNSSTRGNQDKGLGVKIDDMERQLAELRQAHNQNLRNLYSQAVKTNTENTRENITNTNNNRNNGTIIDNRYVRNNTRENNYEEPRGNVSNHNKDSVTIQQKNDPPSHSAQGDINNNSNRSNENNHDGLEINEVLEYISTAMQTLGEFEKRLKQRRHTVTTPSGTS